MKHKILIVVSLSIAAALVAGSYTIAKHVSAATADVQVSTGTDLSYEFAGEMQIQEVCCNGIVFNINKGLGGSVTGSFLFPWYNMIPIPQLGIGLYQYWILSSGKTVGGDATKSGECITIASECESEESIDYTTKKMGVIKDSSESGGGTTGGSVSGGGSAPSGGSGGGF
jgi:hypothetical protein